MSIEYLKNLKEYRGFSHCVNKALIVNLLDIINEVGAILDNAQIITTPSHFENVPQNIINLLQEVEHLQLHNYYDLKLSESNFNCAHAQTIQKLHIVKKNKSSKIKRNAGQNVQNRNNEQLQIKIPITCK